MVEIFAHPVVLRGTLGAREALLLEDVSLERRGGTTFLWFLRRFSLLFYFLALSFLTRLLGHGPCLLIGGIGFPAARFCKVRAFARGGV